MRHIAFALLMTIACDQNGDGTTSTTTGEGCPTLCTEQTPCPPECYPDVCETVGDWCDVALGDMQCGLRMACRELPDDGVAWGVCLAPCSATEPCERGTCDKHGACVDGGVLVPPVKCGS